MYLSYQNGKIVGYTEEPQDLVLYNLDKVEETTDLYVLDGDQYVKQDDIYFEKSIKRNLSTTFIKSKQIKHTVV